MTNTEVIRVTQAADLSSIPETQADILLIFDRDTTLVNGILPFPLNPINWQTYTLSTKSEVTNFSTDTGGKAISGVPSTLPTGVTGWIYILSEDEWFLLSNPPISNAVKVQLDTKLGIGTIANVVYSRVTGSNATTTGQVLVAVTGLQNALEANAVYEFESIMSCSTTAVTTGIGYGVQFSAAGATVEANIVGSSSTTATKTERIIALNTTTTAFLATSNQHGGIRIRGIITTGANAGNLTIQHRKITSGTATAFINSFLRTIRIV